MGKLELGNIYVELRHVLEFVFYKLLGHGILQVGRKHLRRK